MTCNCEAIKAKPKCGRCKLGEEIINEIVKLMDKLDNNNVKKLHGIVEAAMMQRDYDAE